MTNHLESLEINPDAARQYIDARTAFVDMDEARKARRRGGVTVARAAAAFECFIILGLVSAESAVGLQRLE